MLGDWTRIAAVERQREMDIQAQQTSPCDNVCRRNDEVTIPDTRSLLPPPSLSELLQEGSNMSLDPLNSSSKSTFLPSLNFRDTQIPTYSEPMFASRPISPLVVDIVFKYFVSQFLRFNGKGLICLAGVEEYWSDFRFESFQVLRYLKIGGVGKNTKGEGSL